MDKKTVGARIREQRTNHNMTQEKLAAAAGIGNKYLGEIERGLKMPSVNTLIKIINFLEISADTLLRDEVTTAKPYVLNEITERINGLAPRQLKLVSELIGVVLNNIESAETQDDL